MHQPRAVPIESSRQNRGHAEPGWLAPQQRPGESWRNRKGPGQSPFWMFGAKKRFTRVDSLNSPPRQRNGKKFVGNRRQPRSFSAMLMAAHPTVFLLASLFSCLTDWNSLLTNPLFLALSLFQVWMLIDAIRREEWMGCVHFPLSLSSTPFSISFSSIAPCRRPTRI
jgi:hypothetical protein